MELLELSYVAGGNTKWYSYFGRVLWFLTKLNILLPYDPAILDIYSKEWRTYIQTKAALFIIAHIWNQPRCPSVGEWIYKL